MSLYRITNDGVVDLQLHPGQTRAWQSDRRFVIILAGTQSGKTTFLPWILWREIERRRNGDYIAATTTYDLLKLKFLPAMLDCFENALKVGRYWTGDRIIEIRNPITGKFVKKATDPMWARIIMRSADSSSGLESMSAKAALADEMGMDRFGLGSYEAMLRRLSLSRGRFIGASTIYNMGWSKHMLYDRWKAGDPDIDIIQFDSTENPAFPQEEFDKARLLLPSWKFDMFYRGQYARPAGLIYDSFDEAKHVVKPFVIPEDWDRFIGIDFGGVNTAALFYAMHPKTKAVYLYREYHAGNRTAKEHVKALLKHEPNTPIAVGGAPSEGQWRAEFKAAGLPILSPPVSEVEVGIARVYAAHKENSLFVFSDMHGYRDQKARYSRVLDDLGDPTEKIDNKSTFHFLDAERYIVSYLRKPLPTERQVRSVSQRNF